MRASAFLTYSPLQEGTTPVLYTCVGPVFLCQLRCEGAACLVGAAADQPKAALGVSTAAPPSYDHHKPQKSLSRLLADKVNLPFSS